MSLITHYHHLLNQKNYIADSTQIAAISRLQTLYNECHHLSNQSQSILFKPIATLNKWFKAHQPPKGIWLWGGVGRGKSFIMDCFYESMEHLSHKKRIHFHEFMRSIHQELDLLKGNSNPLDQVAKHIAKQYQLLCFDEFHISDIADAMILYRLLDRLFAHGVIFVITSNYLPDQLYPDGLHRDRILPAINLLKHHLDIVNIDAGIDYRRRDLTPIKAYWSPHNAIADTEINIMFNKLSNKISPDTPNSNNTNELSEIAIENRTIKIQKKSATVLWGSFKQLCDTARSQNDYLAIANQFNTLILTDIPQLDKTQATSARRLTWLIDILYDHKIKLIASAKTPPEGIYTEGQFAHEFHRTVSRMIEMQSDEYVQTEQRISVTL